MRIAIYGKTFNPGFTTYVKQVFKILSDKKSEIFIYNPFKEFISKNYQLDYKLNGIFDTIESFPTDSDFIISIGGDGTFLETIPYAIKNDIPVVGLNSGRLGFLANISKEEIIPAFNAIFENNYHIEYRTLLKFISPANIFGNLNFALNEITIQKKGSSLITIDASLDKEFLNTYWTDGLIISTPTGSTAYSISVGGPIVTPGSNNFIVAPIASHNLTVRPIVIPDNMEIKLKAYSRSNKFLVSMDNRTIEIDKPTEFIICKAEFKLQMVHLPNNSFYKTIRNKLMWGVDKRN